MRDQVPAANESESQLDFTSALYLGFSHASASLPPWRRFSTGRPAAMQPPPGSGKIKRELAELVGCEAAVLGPSSLHLFWDLFGQLSGQSVAVYLDSGVYPIVHWASERAAVRRVPVHVFPHHDPDRLERLVVRRSGCRRRPVIVTDAVCTERGEVAPLRDYLSIARSHGGLLVFDDTQGLGILGYGPHRDAPYGRGGGGSWRWHGLEGSDVVSVASMAKGFGAPLAVLCGSHSFVQRFERASETRVHCSPPDVPTLLAANHALRENQARGDSQRFALASLVRRFRTRLKAIGLETCGGLFPIQNIETLTGRAAVASFRRLKQFGVQTVLRQLTRSQLPQIVFIITARHRREDIDLAVAALARVTGEAGQQGDHSAFKLCRDRHLARHSQPGR